MPRVLPALAVLSLCVAPASAAQITHMLTMDGKCQSLVVADIDMTGNCAGAVAQMIYDDGRVGLYLSSLNEGHIYAFSGHDGAPENGVITQVLDQIILPSAADAAAANATPVEGTCTYGDPYSGAAQIACTAKDADGKVYSVAFTTSGTPPVDAMEQK